MSAIAAKVAIVALIAVNLLGFLLMGWDKGMAKRGGWRVPERVLMTVAACFGAAGSFVGMRLFHHKTQKAKFRFGVPVLLIIQIVLLYFVFTTDWTSYLPF